MSLSVPLFGAANGMELAVEAEPGQPAFMAISVDPEDAFHVLIGGQVTPLTLDGLDDAYQNDQIGEDTLIWQQGLGQWLRLDVVLAELEKQDGPPAAVQPPAEDTYYVSFGTDDVRRVSLEQLDDFYRMDIIDESTLVWQPGFAEWVPLSVLIGEAEVAPPVSVAPAPAGNRGTGHDSVRPIASSNQPPVGQNLDGQGLSGQHPSGQHLSAANVGGTAFSGTATGAMGLSDAPVALSGRPESQVTSPWFGRGLLVAAALCALIVVQRNGLAHAAAEDLGQAEDWHQVEAGLGGTSVTTPQGLSSWLEELSARYRLDQLSPTEPVESESESASGSEESGDVAAPKEAHGSEAGEEVTSEEQEARSDNSAKDAEADRDEPEVTKGQAQQGTSKSNALAERMEAKLKGKKAPRPARARRVRRQAPKKKAPAGPKSTGLDAYDPMNGAL